MSNDSIHTKFGIRIAHLRHIINLTQEELAHNCGFSRTYMSRLETGSGNPSLSALEKLAAGLKVELSELFKDL